MAWMIQNLILVWGGVADLGGRASGEKLICHLYLVPR